MKNLDDPVFLSVGRQGPWVDIGDVLLTVFDSQGLQFQYGYASLGGGCPTSNP